MLCHKEVRKIARELAGAAYEDFAKNDDFYKAYPNQSRFIARHWKNFLGIARGTLLHILRGNYPEAMKTDAFEIYIQDRELQEVQTVERMTPQGTA